MRARYRTNNGQIEFEIEGATAKEIFRELASVQEVFDAEHQCGMCESTDLRFLARKVDDFDFYELACNKCRARFAFGQAKKGGALFPKRRDEDGNVLPHNGWSRYQPPNSAGVGNQSTDHYADAPTPATKGNFSSGTAEGMQPIFDRLGQILDKRAPVNVGPALDMVRDALGPFNCKGFFDETYRKFQALTQGSQPTAAQYRGLFKTLMDKYFEVSSDATAA